MPDPTIYINPIYSLFSKNLKVKKSENILVFTDDVRQRKGSFEIPRLIAKEGKNFARITFHFFKATGSHAAEPPLSLWKLALGKKIINEFKQEKILIPLIEKTASDKEIELAHKIVAKNRKKREIDGVIALSWFSTTHTRFRKLLTESYGVRYASMPLFESEMLLGPMNVNIKRMEKRTILLAKNLTKAVKASITSPSGTNLTFNLKGRCGISDTGVLTKNGSVSNLPAGEAYIAPLEGSAKGKMVVNWAPTRKLSKPLIFRIEKGEIKKLSGEKKEKTRLNRIFRKFPNARFVAEFGLGTNEKAKRPDNILESEKILGTIHIAFGDNSTFGGKNKVPFHEDFILFYPTVKLYFPNKKEKTIIKNGLTLFP